MEDTGVTLALSELAPNNLHGGSMVPAIAFWHGAAPRLFSSCSIRPEEPGGCLLKVENNRGWRTRASLFSSCDNSGNQVTVVLGGAGGTLLATPSPPQ